MQTWKTKETQQSSYISKHREPVQKGRHTFQSLICTSYTSYSQINVVKHCVGNSVVPGFSIHSTTAPSKICIHNRSDVLLIAFVQLKIAALQSKLKFFIHCKGSGVACMYIQKHADLQVLFDKIHKSGKHTVGRLQSFSKCYKLHFIAMF